MSSGGKVSSVSSMDISEEPMSPAAGGRSREPEKIKETPELQRDLEEGRRRVVEAMEKGERLPGPPPTTNPADIPTAKIDSVRRALGKMFVSSDTEGGAKRRRKESAVEEKRRKERLLREMDRVERELDRAEEKYKRHAEKGEMTEKNIGMSLEDYVKQLKSKFNSLGGEVAKANSSTPYESRRKLESMERDIGKIQGFIIERNMLKKSFDELMEKKKDISREIGVKTLKEMQESVDKKQYKYDPRTDESKFIHIFIF